MYHKYHSNYYIKVWIQITMELPMQRSIWYVSHIYIYLNLYLDLFHHFRPVPRQTMQVTRPFQTAVHVVSTIVYVYGVTIGPISGKEYLDSTAYIYNVLITYLWVSFCLRKCNWHHSKFQSFAICIYLYTVWCWYVVFFWHV